MLAGASAPCSLLNCLLQAVEPLAVLMARRLKNLLPAAVVLCAAGMKGFWYSYSNIFALLKVGGWAQQHRRMFTGALCHWT